MLGPLTEEEALSHLTSVCHHHLLDGRVLHPLGALPSDWASQEPLEGQEGHPTPGDTQL